MTALRMMEMLAQGLRESIEETDHLVGVPDTEYSRGWRDAMQYMTSYLEAIILSMREAEMAND